MKIHISNAINRDATVEVLEVRPTEAGPSTVKMAIASIG